MTIEITMPALSPTMEEGSLARWLVAAGDRLTPGDVIAEIETDKATMEIEAQDEGVIVSIDVPAGTDNVKVGAVIATLSTSDKAPAQVETAPAPRVAMPVAVSTETRPKVRAEQPTSEHRRRVDERLSPLARRIAFARGLDPARVAGSGTDGLVLMRDLGIAAEPSSLAAPEPATLALATAPPAANPDFGIPYTKVALTNVRRTIARRLTEAKQTIPHIYLTIDVRLDALLRLRGELNEALAARGLRLSVNDLIVKALARALVAVPACNVSFAGDHIREFERVDISVAVAAPGGLVTPIVIDAANRSVSSVAMGLRQLVARANEGRLQPQDSQGGTASLSNLGMYGIRQFDAVINPPQGMIMAVGQAAERLVVEDSGAGVATLMTATGSFDHRAIDGADAARLMQAFREALEDPFNLAV